MKTISFTEDGNSLNVIQNINGKDNVVACASINSDGSLKVKFNRFCTMTDLELSSLSLRIKSFRFKVRNSL